MKKCVKNKTNYSQIDKETMNWLKRWCNSIKKTMFFSKINTAFTDLWKRKTSKTNAEQSLRYYTFNDIPLMLFERCINGEYQYISKDEILTEGCKQRFMDIYFRYTDEIGSKDWGYLHREYADLSIRSLLLNFSKELIVKNHYRGSKTEEMMNQYDYPINDIDKESQLRIIDSYLATLQISLDSIGKHIKQYNQQETKNTSLVSILTQITNINKLYLPYNSVLLVEFIEQYKWLKEQQKNYKNGRPN